MGTGVGLAFGASTPHLASPWKGGGMNLGGGGCVYVCVWGMRGLALCSARYPRRGGNDGVVAGTGVVLVLGAPTPHLASPLEGGRDELGKGVVWVYVCVGGDAGIGAVLGEIPVAGAGMTEWWWGWAGWCARCFSPPT